MGAVEQGTVEGTTHRLRVSYRHAEQLFADDLRWFRRGLLPPVAPEVGRLELELVVHGGPTLRVCAERTPDGGWRLHPGGPDERRSFEEALHSLAVKSLGERWARQLVATVTDPDGRPHDPGVRAPRSVSEVGRRRPR